MPPPPTQAARTADPDINASAQAVPSWTVAPTAARLTPLDVVVALVFFLSGAAALFYQIAWQRLLFTSFGIDIESVTIVVSTFMLGLGVGALAGGWIADRHPTRLIRVFALFELGIGLFGLASADLIAGVATLFVEQSRPVVATVNFLLLLLPTSMMGATLPVLTTEAVRRRGSVGVSIGRLYFVNTLGAATGALLLAAGLFAWMGLRDVIGAAAAINLLVATTVAFAARTTP